jgi:hypothetical protein
MAQIPTTNIGLQNNIQQEYGGGATDVSMSEYYRSMSNSALVDNSAVLPANPYFIFNTSYTPGGYPEGSRPSQIGNINYAMAEQVNRYTSNNAYVPNSVITRTWKYPSYTATRPIIPALNLSVNSTNDPVMPYQGMYAPNGNYLGDVGVPFYFSPELNWPFAWSSNRSSMVISTTVGPSSISGAQLWTTTYALMLAQGSAAGTTLINQTVPTSSQISMGQFKNQSNG